jgi:hypothetical protein
LGCERRSSAIADDFAHRVSYQPSELDERKGMNETKTKELARTMAAVSGK